VLFSASKYSHNWPTPAPQGPRPPTNPWANQRSTIAELSISVAPGITPCRLPRPRRRSLWAVGLISLSKPRGVSARRIHSPWVRPRRWLPPYRPTAHSALCMGWTNRPRCNSAGSAWASSVDSAVDQLAVVAVHVSWCRGREGAAAWLGPPTPLRTDVPTYLPCTRQC
jgi:hypothetical protein